MQTPRDVIFKRNVRTVEQITRTRIQAQQNELVALRMALAHSLPWVRKHIEHKAARSTYRMAMAALGKEHE